MHPDGASEESLKDGSTLPPCTLTVTCKSPQYSVVISAVDILSSARAVEVNDLNVFCLIFIIILCGTDHTAVILLVLTIITRKADRYILK